MTRESSNSSPLRTIRIVLWMIVGFALIGFAVLYFSRSTQRRISTPSQAVSALALGGPFTLTDATGKRFASTTLSGKPYVLFFGFTHCPDVCPTTLARLTRLRAKLGKGDAAAAIVFVTVDPGRDTPAVLRDYAALYDTPIVMLTGTPQEIAKVEKQHGIYAAKVPQKTAPDGYTMDHSAVALVFDKAGKFASTIAPDEPDDTALAKLARVTS